MGNLQAELRFDKNGRAVTKHVRATPKTSGGLLSRIIPMLNGSAAKDRDDLVADLASEIEREISAGAGISKSEEKVAKILKGYSSQTVTAIKDAYSGTGNLVDFIERTYTEKERDIRTAAHFSDLMIHKEFHFASILHSVRTSLAVKDLGSIPTGTDEYEVAQAVLEVAVKASSTRSLDYENRVTTLQARGYPLSEASEIITKEMIQDGTDAFMSPDLARIISDIPERASDIANYLLDKKTSSVKADTGLLLMYLNSDTPALADGML